MLARITLNESGVEHTEDLIWLPESENEPILLHELFVLLGALASHVDNRTRRFLLCNPFQTESIVKWVSFSEIIEDLKSDAQSNLCLGSRSSQRNATAGIRLHRHCEVKN